MKYKILELLFSWMDKPLIHLSFLDICTFLAELVVLSFIIQFIDWIWRKVKGE